jgi:hypothetical protein
VVRVALAGLAWSAGWLVPHQALGAEPSRDEAPGGAPRDAAGPSEEEAHGTSRRPEHDPAELSGIEEPASQPGDAGRTAADVLLFVPRNFVDLLFRGTTAAAGLARDEQIVPRVAEALSTPRGQLIVFPTMFVETGEALSFGARMIGKAGQFTTSYRFGYGIPEDFVMESRVRYYQGGPLPFALTVEGYVEQEGEQEFLGVGLVPERDPRNRFLQPGPGGARVGLYSEERLRGLVSAGFRPSQLFEFFLSASLGRRAVEDTTGAGSQALSRVFAPESIPGSFDRNWIFYGEGAARLDSRPTRGRPSPGALVEAYYGGALSTAYPGPVSGDDVAFVRTGGRVAGFFPIYRRTNILSPRVVLDRLEPLNGLPVPFTELPRQPDFRGFDDRRDLLSVVASLDYTWELVEFLGARLFFDAATVAPRLSGVTAETFEEMRYAGGFGLDLYVSSDDVGQVGFAVSPEGARLWLTVGVPSDHGDRQHRD